MESMSVEATCANCKCKGKLFKRKKKVILIPTVKLLFQDAEEEKEANSERYEKGFLAPHGFATATQIVNFLIWGSLFWVTIMLVANYVNFEKTRFKAGTGSYCVREYKNCTSEFDWNLCATSMYDCGNFESENYGIFNFTLPQKIENPSRVESVAVFSAAQSKANENICLYSVHVDKSICENLCFSSDFSYDVDENYEFVQKEFLDIRKYDQQKNRECRSICMLASNLIIEPDCPFHKNCPNGCPCSSYKCKNDIVDFDLVGVQFGNYSDYGSYDSFYGDSYYGLPMPNPINFFQVSLELKTVKFEHIHENYSFGEIALDFSFCSVQFRGDFYVIKQESSFRLTLHKISKNKRVEKITEDLVTVLMIFHDNSKICSRGIYQDEEDRIIFCSSEESSGICHSYAFKDGHAVLTEIYNRPESTVRGHERDEAKIYGVTYKNQLTAVKWANRWTHSAVSLTSFVGREKSGNHKWTSQEIQLPKYFRDKSAEDDLFFTDLISVFSDNEGIIFVTNNKNIFGRNIIRFHRIYRDNWFFLGRYEFRRQQAILFPTAFMFQGQFFIYEDIRYDTKIFPPKIHLLDHETDKFVEQKIDINIQTFDNFKITV